MLRAEAASGIQPRPDAGTAGYPGMRRRARGYPGMRRRAGGYPGMRRRPGGYPGMRRRAGGYPALRATPPHKAAAAADSSSDRGRHLLSWTTPGCSRSSPSKKPVTWA